MQGDTEVRLNEIRGRVRVATKGPWRRGCWIGLWPRGDNSITDWFLSTDEDSLSYVAGPKPTMVVDLADELEDVAIDGLRVRPFDAEFIAHARQDIPWLLDLTEDLMNIIEKLISEKETPDEPE